MTKKILFNAQRTEQLRVAIVDKRNLCDYLQEDPGREQRKGCVYLGKVTRVEPSLGAAFVDYGQERHGFLPLKEIAYPDMNIDPSQRPAIRDVIKEGQEILVQVDKEERGNKGAALSTFISLAGTYLVLMPNSPKAGGVSRRIEGDDRQNMKEALSHLNLPTDMGVIIRTAGVGRSTEELQWDLDYLLKLWDTIKTASHSHSAKAPFLVYQESDVILRALRDYMRPDIDEIIIDHEPTFNKIKQHLSVFHPIFAERAVLYKDATPLFTRYQIESQIETIFQRQIRLPSGGSIVIDRTEALVSIDVNSAQSTKGGDIEETAFHTNLEAADEIARQLRLRDLGGLIVVDFIDMVSNKHQREVEERLNLAITQDRARIQLGRISRFGLLEMSRQRLRAAIGESAQEVCPRCHGRGAIRGIESVAVSVLRLLEENAVKEGTQQVHAQVPVDVATYLLNEKRNDINTLEHKHHVLIFVIPNPHLLTPDFEVVRFRQTQGGPITASYQMVDETKKPEIVAAAKIAEEEKTEPVVKGVMPEQPAPLTSKPRQKKTSLVSRILAYFKKQAEKPKNDQHKQRRSQTPRHRPRQNDQQRTSHHSRGQNYQRQQGGHGRPHQRNQGSGTRAGQSSYTGNEGQRRHHQQRPQHNQAQEAMQQRPTPEARPAQIKPEPAIIIPAAVLKPTVTTAETIKPAQAPAPKPIQPRRTEIDPNQAKFQQVETQAGVKTVPTHAAEPIRIKPVRPAKGTQKEQVSEWVMVETGQKRSAD